jgi:predicted secreted hydrolase
MAALFLAALAMSGFAPVGPPRMWTFPRDHGSHPEFQTEWWYVTGHLKTEQGASYGYELVFFRRSLERPRDLPPEFRDWKAADLFPAHAAVTDESRGRFHYEERLRRDPGGMAFADTSRLDVRCGDWTLRWPPDSLISLEGSAGPFRFTLDLSPEKPPVLHGEGGVSRKGPAEGQASYYYSLTRLATRGALHDGTTSMNVAGVSWLDHEFFSADIDTSLTGWDWFSLQLDTGEELMLYRLRGRDGTEQDRLSGTYVRADGTAVHLSRGDFVIEATDRWTSARTKVAYPSRWKIRVPGERLDVSVVPTVPDQELDATASTGVVYWEGSVAVRGSSRGKPVTGAGYAELTGYDGRTPMEGP